MSITSFFDRYILLVAVCILIERTVSVAGQIAHDRVRAVRVEHRRKWGDERQPPAEVLLPPMGWNSWNALGCDTKQINERKLKSIIDILVDSGLASAGYQYVNLDDCWMDPAMTGGKPIPKKMNLTTLAKAPRIGSLRADPERFTDGSLATLSSYAHEKGLLFGTYLDAGLATCQGYAGSLGFEEDDAKVLAAWEVDYLKLDGCRMDGMDAAELYTHWSKSLRDAGRGVVFSCSYPAYVQENDGKFPENFDWEKIQDICNLWRLYSDVSAHWKSLLSIMDFWAEHGEVLRKFHGPNGYNDPDMLEIGNEGVTLAESRTQMSIWAVLAAPLILGNDLTSMTEEELAILTNEEVLDVNQDVLVSQGRRIVNDTTHSIWIRECHDRSVAIAIINLQDASQNLGFCWDDIVSELNNISASSLMSDNCQVRIRDLWSHVNIGQDGIVDPKSSPCLNSTSSISAHGTFFIRASFNSECFESSNVLEEQRDSVWQMFSM